MWPFGAGGFVLHGLSAGAAGGLAVAGAAVLTGLYLLKLRRRRVIVAHAPLWVAHPGERRSERWARRLRRWLSLALQLLMFGLLLLAAADPQPAAADRAGRSVVVLIDRSASMSSTDEPGTRLGTARARAQELVAGLGAADRALVASFAAGVTAESGFESDGARLRGAIAGVAPSQEPADLGRALAFAAAVLRGRPHPTLVLVSDGAFADDARQQVTWRGDDAAIDARYLPVGKPPGKAAGAPGTAGTPRVSAVSNVAILGFAARRYPADPDSVEAALTLQNFGAAPAEVAVEITGGAAGDDAARTPVERVRLTLGPGERRQHVLRDVAAAGAHLEARLARTGGDAGADQLALDDHAFAVVPERRRLRVLRVGAPNLYLDGALLSLGGGASLRRAAPAAVESTRASWPDYDAVIFDGVTPAPAPTAGRFLYLAPQGPGSPFADRGALAEPVITDVHRGHPLLRQLDLTDVNIAEARRWTLAPGDVAVASALGAPLLVARERGARSAGPASGELRVAALAFDVRRSDLPMRSAFPLLISNALAWLAGGATAHDGGGTAPAALTGGSARVPVPRGARVVEVRDPAGKRAVWPAAADSADVPVTQVGFYTLKAAGGGGDGDGGSDGAGGDGKGATAATRARPAATVTFAANLADAVESGAAPSPTLTLGDRTLRPPDPPARERHRPLVLAALVALAALLLLEWWSYHRRWTV